MSVNGIRTSGPNGITAKARNAGTVDSTGATRKITLSAAVGMMSSFSASFTPSARDCRRPKGPFTLGPMRCCMRATTRRSNQMLNSVSTTRITKISRALMMITHQASLPKPFRVSLPAADTISSAGPASSALMRGPPRPGSRQ